LSRADPVYAMGGRLSDAPRVVNQASRAVCLFLLLAGDTALAVSQLTKNSVGTKQLKNGAGTGAKVRKGSLPVTASNRWPVDQGFTIWLEG
jgi:hypothetical protein